MAAIALAASLLTACDVAPASADPDNARCNSPVVTVRDARSLADHIEMAVKFTCEGAMQSGTVYLPTSPGQHPAAVWVHGKGPAMHLAFAAPVVTGLVRAGVAVLSYDKRGVGQSQGVCCPGDHQHFNLLAADAVGAVNALRTLSGVDPRRVGLVGEGQAAWVSAVAAARSPSISFLAIADGPTVSNGEALLYRLLTGEEGGGGGVLSQRAIEYRLKQIGRIGFDPLPFLRQVSIPSLWLYGLKDKSIPVDDCIGILKQLRLDGERITIRSFPNASRGLLDDPPSDPDALPALVQWLVGRA